MIWNIIINNTVILLRCGWLHRERRLATGSVGALMLSINMICPPFLTLEGLGTCRCMRAAKWLMHDGEERERVLTLCE